MIYKYLKWTWLLSVSWNIGDISGLLNVVLTALIKSIYKGRAFVYCILVSMLIVSSITLYFSLTGTCLSSFGLKFYWPQMLSCLSPRNHRDCLAPSWFMSLVSHLKEKAGCPDVTVLLRVAGTQRKKTGWMWVKWLNIILCSKMGKGMKCISFSRWITLCGKIFNPLLWLYGLMKIR